MEARSALESVAEKIGMPNDDRDQPDNRLDAPPAIGQTVYVAPFGAEGIVRGLSGKDVDVEIRGKRMRVKLGDLRRRAPESAARPPRAHGAVNVGTAPRPAGAARELVLVGSTVDDALTRAEKFLDDAILNDERRLRVVHGHGTGRLREALRAYLRQHPLVAAVSPAADNEGGGAATIVELKD